MTIKELESYSSKILDSIREHVRKYNEGLEKLAAWKREARIRDQNWTRYNEEQREQFRRQRQQIFWDCELVGESDFDGNLRTCDLERIAEVAVSRFLFAQNELCRNLTDEEFHRERDQLKNFFTARFLKLVSRKGLLKI